MKLLPPLLPFLLFLNWHVLCLEFTINFKQIDLALKPANIGNILHRMSDILALARLLNNSSLPLYHYYIGGCFQLSWPRIKEIMKVYSQVKRSESNLKFAVEALLSSSCLARWPGLWESSPAKLTNQTTAIKSSLSSW